MRKAKNILRLIICAGIVCIGIFGYRIYRINFKYPKADIMTAEMGSEQVMSDGVSMKVLDVRNYFRDEAEKAFGRDITETIGSGDSDYRISVINVELTNTSDQEREIPLYEFTYDSVDYSNGIPQELLPYVTDQYDGYAVLQPGNCVQETLAYVIFDFQFKEKTWIDIDNKEFVLVRDRYPVKRCWMLQ